MSLFRLRQNLLTPSRQAAKKTIRNTENLSHRVIANPTGNESSQPRVLDQRILCAVIFAALRLCVRSFSRNPPCQKLSSKPNCQIDILRSPAVIERHTARMWSEQCNANQAAEFTSVHDSIRRKTRLDTIGICRANPNAKLAWLPHSVIEHAPTRPSSENCKTNPTANLASVGEQISSELSGRMLARIKRTKMSKASCLLAQARLTVIVVRARRPTPKI